MTTQESPAIAVSKWSSELQQVMRQLQEEALTFTLPGMFVIGAFVSILAIQQANIDRSLWFTFANFLTLAVAVLAHRTGYWQAAVVMVIGAVMLNLLAILWLDLSWTVMLLALPTGLATILLGAGAGVSVATLCTGVLLLLPESFLPLSWEMRSMALIAVWGTVGLIWLTLRPLLTAVQWAWSGYEQNRSLLENMQVTQLQLQETLQDLTSANIQLTRLNQLTDGLRQTAEEALHTKEQFVANVSHELRTPLNMIIGFSEMIVNTPQAYGDRIPAPLLSDLSVILRNSRHLSALIDDVLDLSQVEAGHMALTRERIDLAEVIDAATIAVRPLFESKGLSIHVDIEPELPQVFCDRTRVREVVLNLLSNAGRFTERGGAIVRVARDARDARDVIVSVADTGPGIASVNRDRVFQPFEQLDGSIRRRYGGSGLGLAISRSFVEQHGGRMWLSSTPGEGTTFFFSLPIDAPMPVHDGATRWLNPDWLDVQRTHPPAMPTVVVKPRVVVIDPNHALLRLLTRYMESATVTAVNDLSEAVHELARSPAQALIVNSLQVSEWLAQLSKSSQLPYSLPVIICSVPGMSDIVDAQRLGVAGYLVKPIDQQDMLDTLAHLLPRPLSPSTALAPRTVLVIDDEPDAVRLFWRMLDSAQPGYRVLTAANGREGFDILCEQRPDAVLLDLVMPEVDGFEFLAMKNAVRELRDIPVVVISARDASRQPIVSNAIGITKPGGLSLHQLLVSIDAVSQVLSPLAHSSADPAPESGARD